MSQIKPLVFAIVALFVGVSLTGCTGQTPTKIVPNQANVDVLTKDIENRPWE